MYGIVFNQFKILSEMKNFDVDEIKAAGKKMTDSKKREKY